MDQDHDSLDRFLKTRGGQILGSTVGQMSAKAQTAVGVGLLGISCLLALSPLAGAPTEVMLGAIGPFTGGMINLAIGQALLRKISPDQPNPVAYSDDARALLRTLFQQRVGWSFNFGTRGPRNRRIQRRLAIQSHFASEIHATDEVLERLERACEAYQRVMAVITLGKQSPSVQKLGARAWEAADQAMAEVFHHSATLSKFPEGMAAGRKVLDGHIETLNEIARGMESLAASEPIQTTNTRADDLLTDLRLEQLARSEISPDELDRRARLELSD